MDAMRTVPRHSWTPSEPPNLDHVETVAVDYETTGLRHWDTDKPDRPIGIAVAWRDEPEGDIQTYYLPYRHAAGNLPEDTALRWQREQLKGKRILGLNLRFDIHMGYVDGVDFEGMGCQPGDVGHYAALLDDNRRRFGLDSIAQEYLQDKKRELPKGWITQMAHTHAGEIEDYARHDVRLVLQLDDRMEPMMEAQDLLEVASLEDDVIFPTIEMERNGVRLDVEKLELWCNQSDFIVNRLREDIRREAGFPVDPASRESMSRLFRELGITNPFRTAVKGEESFTDAILEKFDHPIIKKVQLFREYTSMRSKFLLNYRTKVDRHGILRYSLHQLACDEGGTVTGRYSSSGMTSNEGINAQQVTKPSKQKLNAKRVAELQKVIPYLKSFVIRELFIPGLKGHQWASADAKQIEYRLFGHFSKAPKILAAYAKDPETDFHNLVMEMVQKTIAGINRDKTKDLNFAKIYGAGLKKIAIMLGFRSPTEPESSMAGVKEVTPFVNAYDAEFPEARSLLQENSKLAESQGWVSTLLGRRARFHNGSFSHKALNRVIQGSAADIMKRKIVELHDARHETGFILRLTVHDEVDGDCPDQASLDMIKAILDKQSFDLRVPILWDVGMGPNWKDS